MYITVDHKGQTHTVTDSNGKPRYFPKLKKARNWTDSRSHLNNLRIVPDLDPNLPKVYKS